MEFHQVDSVEAAEIATDTSNRAAAEAKKSEVTLAKAEEARPVVTMAKTAGAGKRCGSHGSSFSCVSQCCRLAKDAEECAKEAGVSTTDSTTDNTQCIALCTDARTHAEEANTQAGEVNTASTNAQAVVASKDTITAQGLADTAASLAEVLKKKVVIQAVDTEDQRLIAQSILCNACHYSNIPEQAELHKNKAESAKTAVKAIVMCKEAKKDVDCLTIKSGEDVIKEIKTAVSRATNAFTAINKNKTDIASECIEAGVHITALPRTMHPSVQLLKTPLEAAYKEITDKQTAINKQWNEVQKDLLVPPSRSRMAM